MAHTRNLTLVVSGPIVAGRTGNDEQFVEKLFEVWVRGCLVPRNQDRKWDEVQIMWCTFTLAMEQTDKSMFRQVDLPGVLM